MLPTGGTARFASGLTANDFRKRTSILRFTRNGLQEIADGRDLPGEEEGLTGHAASVELRANDNGPAARPKPKPDKVPAAAARRSRAEVPSHECRANVRSGVFVSTTSVPRIRDSP